MRNLRGAMPLLALAIGLGAAGLADAAAPSSSCDAACLRSTMEEFLAAVTGNQPGSVRLGPGAKVMVNAVATTLDRIPLANSVIRSQQVYVDPVTGNVVARTGIALADGKIAYASTRLKVVERTITEVETSYDDRPAVVASYVTFLDPLMTTIVPPEQRMSRAELAEMVSRYFQTLTDHLPTAADYDDRCDRYHSGQRITNNPRSTVEGTQLVTCFSSVGGTPPWGPAIDIHIPVVDPEHGIVIGYALLQYAGTTRPMYISEVFKILGGKFRMIENIGLRIEGLQPTGFKD